MECKSKLTINLTDEDIEKLVFYALKAQGKINADVLPDQCAFSIREHKESKGYGTGEYDVITHSAIFEVEL